MSMMHIPLGPLALVLILAVVAAGDFAPLGAALWVGGMLLLALTSWYLGEVPGPHPLR